jgi:MoaA/NifB/PqqE/SkfB family radical SAM enzyme
LKSEPTLDELKNAIDIILRGDDEEKPILLFSGGKPAMRDDLQEFVTYAHEKRCRYTQLNSNGFRLDE